MVYGKKNLIKSLTRFVCVYLCAYYEGNSYCDIKKTHTPILICEK